MVMASFRYVDDVRPLVRRIPQLHRLAVLDAVASTGGFTAAARELGISQPAVSRHIATIERQLGIELFERSGGAIRPTVGGRRLADAVDVAFTSLERALDELVPDRDTLVFAVQPAMATSWIVPAFESLAAAAGSEIRLRIFDRRSDLDIGEWDLAIVPGDGDWSGWTCTELFHEAVRPLASPGLAAQLGLHASSDPDELLGATLLHVDAEGRPSMTWPEWFEEAGSSAALPKPRIVYDTYPTVIQEALVGHGIALGWRHLDEDLLERGLLVPVGPVVERPRVGHHLCWRRDRDDARHRSVRAWLVERIGPTGLTAS